MGSISGKHFKGSVEFAKQKSRVCSRERAAGIRGPSKDRVASKVGIAGFGIGAGEGQTGKDFAGSLGCWSFLLKSQGDPRDQVI